MTHVPRLSALAAMLIVATVIGFPLHEFAHWAMGGALGHDMAMSLNRAVPRGEVPPGTRDLILIAAAGPVFTLTMGLIAFWWSLVRDSRLAYVVLFAAWFERLAAAFVSLLNPNDEARIGLLLGIGTWTLPAAVVLGLFALLWIASRRLAIGWKANIVFYLVSSMVVAAVVFADAAMFANGVQ